MKQFYAFLGFTSLVMATAALVIAAIEGLVSAVQVAMLISLDCAILAVGAAILSREE